MVEEKWEVTDKEKGININTRRARNDKYRSEGIKKTEKYIDESQCKKNVNWYRRKIYLVSMTSQFTVSEKQQSIYYRWDYNFLL